MGSSERPSSPSAGLGLWAAQGLLAVVLAVAFPAFAWYGKTAYGADGLVAAAVALAVCWAGAASALLVVSSVRGSPMAGLLASMFLRMGFPLGVGLLLQSQRGALAAANVFGMIVMYYLLALAVETALSLRVTASSAKNVKNTKAV